MAAETGDSAARRQVNEDFHADFDIEKAKPILKIENKGRINRPLVTQEHIGHTSFRALLDRVQYGTYNGRPACLLALDFSFTFRSNTRARYSYAEIELSFERAVDKSNPRLRSNEPLRDPKTANFSPVHLIETVTVKDEREHAEISTPVMFHSSVGLGATFPTLSDWQVNTREKNCSEIQGSIYQDDQHDEGANGVTWELRENETREDGIILSFRGVVIIHHEPDQSFWVHVSVKPAVKFSLNPQRLFAKSDFLAKLVQRNDDPVFLDGKTPLQDQVDLKCDDFSAATFPWRAVLKTLMECKTVMSSTEAKVEAEVKVVRVQNIPRTQSEAEFLQILVGSAEPTISIRVRIAPSCTAHDGSQVAIVKFSPQLPSFLTAMGADRIGTTEHQIPLGPERVVYTFDKHFFGLTQLYPTLKDPIADIVAVTGLNGRGYDSWRGKNPNGDMWLQDYFAKDLPFVRTMIYGYNTKWTSPGTARTDDLREGLSQALQTARRSIDSHRPLILIGHSFGAILIGRLLTDWKIYNELPFSQAAFQATKALFLFGAPHRGMDIEDIAEMAKSQNADYRSELLNSLGYQNEQNLIVEAERLSELSNSLRIFSFYERRLSQRLTQAKDGSGRYERQGALFDYVSLRSATLGLPRFLEQRIPVDANHSDLVKFNHPADQTYQITLQYVQEVLGLTVSPSHADTEAD